METLSFHFPLCWCMVVCQVKWKLIGRISCFITHLYILYWSMSYLNLIFQDMVSYDTASFPLTASVNNCTQFNIRNSMVVSAYLTQVFLKHELLLLSFTSDSCRCRSQQPQRRQQLNLQVQQGKRQSTGLSLDYRHCSLGLRYESMIKHREKAFDGKKGTYPQLSLKDTWISEKEWLKFISHQHAVSQVLN